MVIELVNTSRAYLQRDLRAIRIVLLRISSCLHSSSVDTAQRFILHLLYL